MAVARRSYEQLCPVAFALDLVGERWTLLVVRELLAGPRRYTDLQTGLPGIGSDLLTARLRDLEQAGAVARRRLPPPAASTVYELTDRGRELEPVIFALGRFGFGLVPAEPPAAATIPTDRLALALRLLFDAEATRGRHDRYLLQIADAGTIAIEVDDGELRIDTAPAPNGAPTITADTATMYAVAAGTLSPADALTYGRVRADNPAALASFLVAFPPHG